MLGLVCTAGCTDLGGLSGGGAAGDAGADGRAPGDPSGVRLVQSFTTAADKAKITPTKPGSLVVVVAVRSVGGDLAISDDAPGGSSTYVQAVQGLSSDSAGASCGVVSIWYARTTGGGITTLDFSWTNGTNAAWILEVSGLAPTNDVVRAGIEAQPPASVMRAPEVTPSAAPFFVVSAVAGCSEAAGIEPGSAFTSLPYQGGDGVAYLVGSAPGSYGARWMANAATAAPWSAVTAAF